MGSRHLLQEPGGLLRANAFLLEREGKTSGTEQKTWGTKHETRRGGSKKCKKGEKGKGKGEKAGREKYTQGEGEEGHLRLLSLEGQMQALVVHLKQPATLHQLIPRVIFPLHEVHAYAVQPGI